MFPAGAAQQGWPIVLGYLMDLDSDDVVSAVNRCGLNVDWTLTDTENYTHRTRKRAYQPRIQAAFVRLDDGQKDAVFRALVEEVIRLHPRGHKIAVPPSDATAPTPQPTLPNPATTAPVPAATDTARVTDAATAVTQSRPTIVISLHGIRTRGKWQKDLTTELQRGGFGYEPLDFGFFRAIQLLWPGARQKRIAWFRDEYTRIVRENRDSSVSVIAHSFGTYLVARALDLFPEIVLDQVVLCGSIVRPDFEWSRLVAACQVRRVLNDYGRLDFWAGIVGWVVEDAGSSGTTGFKDVAGGAVIQREHAEFRHSDYFYKLNFEKNWVPFLRGETPSDLAASDRRPANWKFRTTLGAVTAILVVLAVLGLRLVSREPSVNLETKQGERASSPPSNTTGSDYGQASLQADFGDGFGDFKFGMSPEEVNAKLPTHFASIDWTSMPKDSMYSTAEVKYFWVPLAAFENLPRWKFYEKCATGQSYVAFLFLDKRLFRVSVRFAPDCSARFDAMEHFASFYGIKANAHKMPSYEYDAPVLFRSAGSKAIVAGVAVPDQMKQEWMQLEFLKASMPRTDGQSF